MGEKEILGERELALEYLKKLEKKHKAFFKKAGLKIKDCVMLKGLDKVSVYVINYNIPSDIKCEIERMFLAD
ncbi:MAG: hypothetical protein ACXVI9_04690 [Mucilaginibacter sp.]